MGRIVEGHIDDCGTSDPNADNVYARLAVSPGTYAFRMVGPAPEAPANLASTVVGATVVLNWNAPLGVRAPLVKAVEQVVAAPTSYVIEAGSAPAALNLANFDTGTTSTSFTAKTSQTGCTSSACARGIPAA